MVGGVTVDETTEDEDGRTSTPLLGGETLRLGIAVWFGLGTGMES